MSQEFPPRQNLQAADGARVKGTVGGVTTYYPASHFEFSGSTGKKYFYAGGRLVGMRSGTGASTTNLTWLTVDHLGSTSKAANGSTGAQNDSQTYKAWGETRYPTTSTLPTTKRYTGQRHEPGLGIYWYGSRWWDPWTGRFLSPDPIIPLSSQGVQAWDRYAGMNNNPIRFNDPSGHCILLCSVIGAAGGAIVGGLIYAATAQASGREWNNNDFWVSVGTGAVGGALIGTGIGAAAGVATFAGIGAGSGVLAGQLGYSATAGANFDSGNMVISAAASGVAGGITGAVGASSIAGSGTAFAIDFAANGGASAAQYTATQLSNGQPVNPAVAGVNGLAGGVVGGASDLLFGGSLAGDYARRWMGVANNPATRSSLSGASRMALGGLLVYGGEQLPRAGAANWITNYWQHKLAEAE